MPARLHMVNFGSAKGGLSTVTWALYNSDGTVNTAASTTGVNEFGSSTGIYGAVINITPEFDGAIIWSTGEATPRYGVFEAQADLTKIANEIDDVRIIRNTLKNQADFQSAVLSKMRTDIVDPMNEANKVVSGKLDVLADKAMKPSAAGPSRQELSAIMESQVQKLQLDLEAVRNLFPELKSDLVDWQTNVVTEIRRMFTSQEKPDFATPDQVSQAGSAILAELREFRNWMNKNSQLILDQRLGPVAKKDDVARDIKGSASQLEKTVSALTDKLEKAVDANAKPDDVKAVIGQINDLLKGEVATLNTAVAMFKSDMMTHANTNTNQLVGFLLQIIGAVNQIQTILTQMNNKPKTSEWMRALAAMTR